MKCVVFGLTISSSWGNGHATLWRGLCRALSRRGHQVTFFEKDTPYYSRHRDSTDVAAELVLYSTFSEIRERAAEAVNAADAAIVTSFCPDGIAATRLVTGASRPRKVFYDLDTPVTLAALDARQPLSYIGPEGLAGFDLVLSFTGGPAVDALRTRLGARRVGVLYGHVDPEIHVPVPSEGRFAADLSYLGTYSDDRRLALDALFFGAAERAPQYRLTLGGSMYPEGACWPRNVRHFRHVEPASHAAFFCSSRATLNVTRSTMAAMGYCPSGRLFEAAACAVPILSDSWRGLEQFFRPGEELVVVRSADDVLSALARPPAELDAIGERGRQRVLREHTAEHRAEELEEWLWDRRHLASHSRVQTGVPA